LGSTTGATTVRDGAELKIAATGVAEPITLNGLGLTASPAGALHFVGSSLTLSGPVTLGSDSRINSDSAGSILSGGVTGAGHALTIGVVGSSSTLEITTAGISDATTLTKDGTGTLTLSVANTYSGDTTINSATGTTSMLKLGANNVIPDTSAVILSSNNKFNLNGFSETVKTLSGTGGSVYLNGGTLTLDNPSGET
jgi:autotransporter-associated beta strand protein